MPSNLYKQRVEEALKDLRLAQENIFTSLVNIAVEGELKEWNAIVEVGEKFKFDLELFERSDDRNITILVNLFNNIDNAYESLKNLNDIRD